MCDCRIRGFLSQRLSRELANDEHDDVRLAWQSERDFIPKDVSEKLAVDIRMEWWSNFGVSNRGGLSRRT